MAWDPSLRVKLFVQGVCEPLYLVLRGNLIMLRSLPFNLVKRLQTMRPSLELYLPAKQRTHFLRLSCAPQLFQVCEHFPTVVFTKPLLFLFQFILDLIYGILASPEIVVDFIIVKWCDSWLIVHNFMSNCKFRLVEVVYAILKL